MDTQEVWKDIAGYEGYYQISDSGKVRSLDRIVNSKEVKGKIKKLKSIVIKPQSYLNGYLFVNLSKNGIIKQFSIARLVATAFIPNPAKLPEVNHKDEIKTNNSVNNLNWCSHKENANYGTKIERTTKTIRERGSFSGSNNPMFGRKGIKSPVFGRVGKYNSSSIPVIRIGQCGELKVYESISLAAKDMRVTKTSICRAVKGKVKKCAGYKWKYLSELEVVNN